MCYPGEVFQVALPAGLKISSQSKVQVNPEFSSPETLTDRELSIYVEIRDKGAMSYDDLAKFAEVKSPYHLIKALVGKDAVIIFDELKDRYTPKVQRKIRLAANFEEE